MSQPNNDALLRRAKQVVRADLNSYDLLSRPAKIRRTHEHELVSDTSTSFGPQLGYVCGHKISLCSPCEKCTRSADDCIEYQVALRSKLKDLLSQLQPKS
jgi:hypothetical protein